MTRIDLHTHTLNSDGTFTPRELVALAVRNGLGALALTDHDTPAGLEEAILAAKEHEIEFVPGIEISTHYNRKELHLLGLFIDWRARAMTDAVEHWRSIRRERNAELLARLHSAGIYICMGQIESLAQHNSTGSAIITRSHFARAITDAGYCTSPQNAFSKYLLPGTPTYVERQEISPADAISAIRSAGGLAILAHPLRYGLNLRQIEPIIKSLQSDGLNGMECYYSSHTPYEQEQLIRIAKKYRLCISGGSDFHGFHDGTMLGTGYGSLYVPMFVYDELKELKERLTLADGQA